MQTEEALARRIKTAQDLHGVVRTMKALAAVNIRQFEQAVVSVAGYTQTVELALQATVGHTQLQTGASAAQSTGPLGLVVFGTDQGMCGQLNKQMAEQARRGSQLPGGFGEPLVVAVGARLGSHLEDAGFSVQQVFRVPSSVRGLTALVQDLVLCLDTWQRKHRVARVRLVHAQTRTRTAYDPVTVDLLPLDRPWLQEMHARRWPNHQVPQLAAPADRLAPGLIREYLFVSLYRAMAESLANENASRLAVMQAAQKNIEERITELTRQYHQQRQAAVTEELLDVAAAAEALQPNSSQQHSSQRPAAQQFPTLGDPRKSADQRSKANE